MAEDEEGGNRGGEKVQIFNYVPSDNPSDGPVRESICLLALDSQ